MSTARPATTTDTAHGPPSADGAVAVGASRGLTAAMLLVYGGAALSALSALPASLAAGLLAALLWPALQSLRRHALRRHRLAVHAITPGDRGQCSLLLADGRFLGGRVEPGVRIGRCLLLASVRVGRQRHALVLAADALGEPDCWALRRWLLAARRTGTMGRREGGGRDR